MFANNENGSLKDMANWCQDADLLVHDAQFSREEYKTHAGFGHSTYEEALALAEQAGVQQLAFFHHDPAQSMRSSRRLWVTTASQAAPTWSRFQPPRTRRSRSSGLSFSLSLSWTCLRKTSQR
jgi:ribonuclease BN (tRNA processing enzyme)